MNCGCNGNISEVVIQRGNTFNIVMQYKEDGTPTQMPQGYDMVVGFYDGNGDLVKKASYTDGSINYADNVYTLQVTHEESMAMVGRVTLELTIFDTDMDVVEHASEVIGIKFEERRNNGLL